MPCTHSGARPTLRPSDVIHPFFPTTTIVAAASRPHSMAKRHCSTASSPYFAAPTCERCDAPLSPSGNCARDLSLHFLSIGYLLRVCFHTAFELFYICYGHCR